MVAAGLDDIVIVARLRKENKPFDLSPDEMIKLKKAGVSNAVMQVMLDPNAELETPVATSPSPTPVSPAPVTIQPATIPFAVPASNPSGATISSGSPAPTGDPNDPMTPHDSGIYVHTKDRDGKPVMILLERAAYQGSKTGGVFASSMTLGIKKAKMKALIPGSRASLRVADPAPTFYFYFDDKAAGLGKSHFGSSNVSNPNQFALVKLEVKESNRETIIGEYGSLGASTGTHAKSMMAFRSDRLRPGLYKVVTTAPLDSGEYCFLASGMAMGALGAGATGAVDIFDFAVVTQ